MVRLDSTGCRSSSSFIVMLKCGVRPPGIAADATKRATGRTYPCRSSRQFDGTSIGFALASTFLRTETKRWESGSAEPLRALLSSSTNQTLRPG